LDGVKTRQSGGGRVAEAALPDPHAHTSWIERHLCVPRETEETRQRKVQFTIASILVVPAGFLWGVRRRGKGV
jgi:hypothetical protein